MSQENFNSSMHCNSKVPNNGSTNLEQANINLKKRCAYCERIISVDSEEIHLLDYCEVFDAICKINCGTPIEKILQWSINRSYDREAKPKQSSFSKSKILPVRLCKYCRAVLDDKALLFHEKNCLYRPMKCINCSKQMPVKYYPNHICKPPKRTDEANDTKCSYCKEVVENTSSHEEKCLDKTFKCPTCSDVIRLREWFDHECQMTRVKDNPAIIKCSYCKEAIECTSSHEKKCLDKPFRCPTCNDVIKIREWHNHECQKARVKANEKLAVDLEGILKSGVHSDIIIKVQNEEFRLHKNILAGRNSYFDSMLKTGVKEQTTSILSIEDCEPDVFRSFIYFVYTGKIQALSHDNVCSLYKMADKYQEEQLKEECLCFMKKNISVESFCDFLLLALVHHEKDLLEMAIEIFCRKTKEIILSEKWQTFMREYPVQANELHVKALDHSTS